LALNAVYNMLRSGHMSLFFFSFFFFQASLLSTGTGYLHGLAFYGFYLHIVGLCFAVGERDTKVRFVY